MGMKPFIDLAVNSYIGGVAVTFFFVLSGFLITSLLLDEKARLGTIRLKRFFVNRALRIWPLYYLTLFAGYMVSILLLKETSSDMWENGLILNFLLLPNVAFAMGLLPEILIQIWSIGTEEQFYFLWPFLVRRLGAKPLIRVFIGVILFWLVARGMIRLIYGAHSPLNIFLFRTRIDCMAIGGLAAMLFFHAPGGWASSLHRLLLKPITGWALAMAFILLLSASYRYEVSFYQLYALLFAMLILRVIRRPGGWLESPPLRYLGKISYGIYLLQQFAVFFIFRAGLSKENGFLSSIPMDSRPAGIALFLLAALMTIGLASLSYRFFESRFLKRKF